MTSSGLNSSFALRSLLRNASSIVSISSSLISLYIVDLYGISSLMPQMWKGTSSVSYKTSYVRSVSTSIRSLCFSSAPYMAAFSAPAALKADIKFAK